MYAIVASAAGDLPISILLLSAEGVSSGAPRLLTAEQWPRAAAELERSHHPRWVWDRAQHWYPQLLAAGVRVERCHDLALCQTILRHSVFTAGGPYTAAHHPLPAADEAPAAPVATLQDSLFEQPPAQPHWDVPMVLAELQAQKAAVAAATHPARLTLLLGAESACALVAAEMQFEGIPWREDIHRELLLELLGPEPSGYDRPAKMAEVTQQLRAALAAPTLNPDSPQDLMRALHRAGIPAQSTRSWELQEFTHPAIAPLLQYRKLSRLFTSNGWAWLAQWVHDGRFHSEYMVGGVVSGRWASRGGGAMQIPKQIRGAARAAAGHKFIVADAAQLEPRVLAALARDSAMATAGRDKDLYAGIAAQGFGGDRALAKVALLGAIYGATSGDSGRLMPQLARMYPQAIAFVEEAARAGERGEQVSTLLGRSTPAVTEQWWLGQRSSTAEEQRRAEAAARTRGRFTRNFVVQGTAAEWACCWLAELRRRLRALSAEPQLVFFLHDEVMVHCPDALVDTVTAIVHEAAAAATRLLFGEIPLEFPVNVSVVQIYAEAK